MIIDRETFTELAVHLKLASDAILSTTQHLAAISAPAESTPTEDAEWEGTIESMMSVNHQITVMEQLLRAVMDANHLDEGACDPSQGGPLPN